MQISPSAPFFKMKIPKFKLKKQGAIYINIVEFLFLSDDAFLLTVDCKQKYVNTHVVDDEGELSVMIYPDKNTLHIPDDAPREPNGDFKATFFDVEGIGGPWHISVEDGRYGVWIFGIRETERNADLIIFAGEE